MQLILLVAIGVALAPVAGAILLGIVCIAMYVFAVLLELINGKSIKQAVR